MVLCSIVQIALFEYNCTCSDAFRQRFIHDGNVAGNKCRAWHWRSPQLCVWLVSAWLSLPGVAALFAFQPPSGLFHTNYCSTFPDRVAWQRHLVSCYICLWFWCRGAGMPSAKLRYLLTSAAVSPVLSFTVQMCSVLLLSPAVDVSGEWDCREVVPTDKDNDWNSALHILRDKKRYEMDCSFFCVCVRIYRWNSASG